MVNDQPRWGAGLVVLTLCATAACSSPSGNGSNSEGSSSARAMSASAATSSASAATNPSNEAAPSASPSGAAPPSMPAEVVSCEPAGRSLGGFEPSAEQLLAAAAALVNDVCLPRAIAADAIRACAAKLGKTNMEISTDKLSGAPKGCTVTIQGASDDAKAHQWIVFRGAFRDGSNFTAGSTAVELGTDKARVFLDSLGDHAELCPTTSITGKEPAADKLPSGWKDLAEPLKLFLCNGSDA